MASRDTKFGQIQREDRPKNGLGSKGRKLTYKEKEERLKAIKNLCTSFAL